MGEISWRGVTSVVGRLFPGQFDKIPPHVLENARHRGLALHTALEDYFNTGLYEVPFEYQARMDMFEEFMAEYEPVMLDQELELKNEELRLRGRCDNIMKMKDGRVMLLDFKFTYGVNEPYVELQLSLYKMLLDLMDYNPQIEGIGVLHISKDSWEFIELEYKQFHALNLLYLDDYLQEKGLKRK